MSQICPEKACDHGAAAEASRWANESCFHYERKALDLDCDVSRRDALGDDEPEAVVAMVVNGCDFDCDCVGRCCLAHNLDHCDHDHRDRGLEFSFRLELRQQIIFTNINN